MYTTEQTISYKLSLDETISRLMRSEEVDGLAFFGSRTTTAVNPTSDYDLLLLLKKQPVDVFQMFTYIDKRMADIVISDSETADRVLSLGEPMAGRSPGGMLIQKLWDGQIVYDPSQRLQRVQEHLSTRPQLADWLIFSTESEKYAAWFWQNHGLSHVKRMVQSDDQIYLSAADLMLMTGLADVCRSYYIARDLLWQGEKRALKYLKKHNPTFLERLQMCIGETDRMQKVSFFEALVAEALEPVAALWNPGVTTIYLRESSKHPSGVAKALHFWEGLLHIKT